MRRFLILFLITGFLFSCGSESETTHEADEAVLADGEFIEFDGFVGGIFEIEVVGVTYADSESYYTAEMAAMPGKLEEAGYVGYDFEFDAEVGFDDLWNNMTVYISPTEKQGYQGRSEVNREGAFSITLPSEAADSYYKVKSNKRINVILTKDTEVKKICFNSLQLINQYHLVSLKNQLSCLSL